MRSLEKSSVWGLVAFALALVVLSTIGQQAKAKDYGRNTERCGPFVRVAVSTAPGLCLGLVAQDVKGMRFPRSVIQIEPGIFWITDMGGWTPNRGKLWRMNVQDPKAPRFRVLDQGLDRPHGLVRGDDGRVYLGTAGAVWRYDPADPRPQDSKRQVIAGLPTEGRHPLTNLAFDPKGALIINVGAPSDHCELDPDQPNKIATPCPSSQGGRPQAALYRARILGDRVDPPQLLAHGLRNSMALAFHPQTGLLLQAENNIDYKEPDQPKEELNIIEPGAHYGWPYCIEEQKRARHYRKKRALDCAKTRAPVRLLPAHAAPLGLVFSGASGLSGYRNHWVVGYHGYRATGQRIVAIEADEAGRPTGPLTELVFDWHKRPGLHPRGAPVALSFDKQGWLWMADDRNKAILVLMAEQQETSGPLPTEAPKPDLDLGQLAQSSAWADFYHKQLRPRCGACHEVLQTKSAERALVELVAQGWLTPLHPAQGLIYRAISGQDGQPLMPPPKGLAPARRLSWQDAILSFRLDL